MDEISSDESTFDDYADLSDFDDGATFNHFAEPMEHEDDEQSQMNTEAKWSLILDVETVKEKFEHLASKPEVGVARVQGDVVSLYLPFYSYLNKSLQLAWKEYEQSYVVVDIKVCLKSYREAKNLPLVTIGLSTGTRTNSFQLFCDHLRTIAQDYLRETFKDREQNVLAGLFEALLERIEDVSNFCCFCDKPLGDEGSIFPTFCSSFLCSFQGEEFLRAHPSEQRSERAFFKKLDENFSSLNFSQQTLNLHESPGQVAAFERWSHLKGVKFLLLNSSSSDEWLNICRHPRRPRQAPIRLSETRIDDECVLCEVIDDSETLVKVGYRGWAVSDARTIRFRLVLAGSLLKPPLNFTSEDMVRLRNELFALRGDGYTVLSPDVEVGGTFDFQGLPCELRIQIIQLTTRVDVLHLKKSSKSFQGFLETQWRQFCQFQGLKLKIGRVKKHKKDVLCINLENLFGKQLVEIVFKDNFNFGRGSSSDEELSEESTDDKVRMEIDEEKKKKRPMFDNRKIEGDPNAEWKAVVIRVKNHTVLEVVERLASMLNFARLELHKISCEEVKSLLEILPNVTELHLANADGFTFSPQQLLPFLSPNLTSLCFDGKRKSLTSKILTNPLIRNLQELHFNGGCDAIPDETFQALRVPRLSPEGSEVTLKALHDYVCKWKRGEREILSFSLKIVDYFQRKRRRHGNIQLPQRPEISKERIFQVLEVDRITSRLRRATESNLELEVEALPNSAREHLGTTLVKLVACVSV